MARNEEKAMTMWNKWQTFKQDYHAVSGNRRPLGTTPVASLPEMEKTRRDILSKITRSIAAIKNATLGEMKIRELNDEINKLNKQKHYYEIRIRELGGNVPMGGRSFDLEGKELPGAPGYRYYGAAQNLPGIRELFLEQETVEAAAAEGEEGDEEGPDRKKTKKEKRRTRKDLYASLPPEYFGYTRTMNRRVPNPFLAQEEGWEEEDPSLFNLTPPHPEDLKLRQIELEWEERCQREYEEQHPEEIGKEDDPEILSFLQNAHKISEEVMESMKEYYATGGKSDHPLSATFSIDQLAQQTVTTTSEAMEAESDEDITKSKQSLLAQLDLF